MNDWLLRFYYGRGAARVLVAMPRVGFETVPLRPGREVMASLSPLYLALLLPLGVLLLEMNGSQLEVRDTDAAIEIASYENIDAAVPVPPDIDLVIAPSKPAPPLPAPPMPRAASPQLAALPQPPGPAARAFASTVNNQVLAGIEMDQLDRVRSVSRVATQVRVASLAGPRRAAFTPNDFAPVASDAAPPSLPAPARASKTPLPSVSLPGPALRRTISVDGVEAIQAGPALLPSPAPVLAPLPEPANSAPFRTDFEAVESGIASARYPSEPLEGVPLESLAACGSREREDELKQELMLMVTGGTQCTGGGGTYSFLETKNLNAFLLRVARDSDRDLGNRCDELMRAQVCVVSGHVAGAQP